MDETQPVPQPVSSQEGSQGKISLGSFVSTTYNLYQNMFKSFFAVYWLIFQKYFIIIIPALLLNVFAALYADKNVALAGILGLLSLAAAIVFVYFYIWAQIAFIYMVRNRNSALPVEEVIASAKPQIYGYFSTSVTSGIMTLLWTLLLIVPGIIMGLYYSMAEYVYIDTGLKNMEALRASKKLIEGYWLPVFGRFLILVLIIIIPVMVASAIFTVLPDSIESLGGFALSLFYTPFGVIYGYLIYEKLKSIKGTVQ